MNCRRTGVKAGLVVMLQATKNPAAAGFFLAMVGVARIELATPTMSTQRESLKAADFGGLA
jgi:hypothetical protein